MVGGCINEDNRENQGGAKIMKDSEEESRIKALIAKREHEEANVILTLRTIRGEIEELKRKLEKGGN
jgi:hypothetical protein